MREQTQKNVVLHSFRRFVRISPGFPSELVPGSAVKLWLCLLAKSCEIFFLACSPLHRAPHPSRLQVHPKSSKPYEVEWRPYDSGGCDLALNPKTRIALTPRLFVTNPETFEKTGDNDPPAGTAPKGDFQEATKQIKLTVPPIGSWSIVDADEPWGQLGPFAF